MKTRTTKWKWLGAALLMVAALCGRAQAANPSILNIDVTISASLSVSVNGVASSTDATTTWSGTPNFASTATAAASVKNDSGILSEKWALSTNANTLSPSGVTWGLSASTSVIGSEAFAVQAVFGSSNTTTTCGNASWTNGTIAPILPTSPSVYTSGGAFADGALTQGGGLTAPDSGTQVMFAFNAASGAGLRKLCWRAIMPSSTAAPNAAIENIQVIVTAQ